MLPNLLLERGGRRSLYDQLTHELRQLILTGQLAPGTRLPSSRDAARALQVSRTVVVEAYEQLVLEGYLDSRVGAGTWVCRSLPSHLLGPKGRRSAATPRKRLAPRLSQQGRRLVREWDDARFTRRHGPFRPGGVAVEHFPHRLWARLASRAWCESGHDLIGYGEAAGHRPLREAIAEHLASFRAVHCHPDQILITAGSQQGLDLLARLLVDIGDRVFVEDPGYPGAKAAFLGAGATLVPVPVDGDGMVPPPIESGAERARLVYCTPSHQYPLGLTMSLERRLRLLKWAQENGTWILEDDYDSEFRYEGRPLPALQGLEDDGRVIYIGTFSKVLAPGLRIGYMVLPEELIEPVCAARIVLDFHPAAPLQAALADFIGDGHLERHIARMRGVYDERRQTLQSAIASQLADSAEIVSGSAGLYLTVLLPPQTDDVNIAERALSRLILPPPLSVHYLGDRRRPGLILGFGGAPPEALVAGVDTLRDIIAFGGH